MPSFSTTLPAGDGLLLVASAPARPQIRPAPNHGETGPEDAGENLCRVRATPDRPARTRAALLIGVPFKPLRHSRGSLMIDEPREAVATA